MYQYWHRYQLIMKLSYPYRHRPIWKSDILVGIGIGQYEKMLISRSLTWPNPMNLNFDPILTQKIWVGPKIYVVATWPKGKSLTRPSPTCIFLQEYHATPFLQNEQYQTNIVHEIVRFFSANQWQHFCLLNIVHSVDHLCKSSLIIFFLLH